MMTACRPSLWQIATFSVIISVASCFMTLPRQLLESTVLSSSNSAPASPSSNIVNTTWNKPVFGTKPFSSYWYYWISTPGRTLSNNINYGMVEWLFNTTHMYYAFTLPSIHSVLHQYTINDTMYLWQEVHESDSNDTRIDCYSYKVPFHIITNYFANSSFVGLTDAPNSALARSFNFASFSNSSSNTTTTTTTASPTPSPTPFYPMTDAESMWMGYLFTERIFGHNMSYLVTAKADGSIGRLHVTFNARDINLQQAVSSAQVMWLNNITYHTNSTHIAVELPVECKTEPDNPTMSPTLTPTITTQLPTNAPTNVISPSNISCTLPPMMIILYVVIVAVFLLLLFCWYAKKKRYLSRIIENSSFHAVPSHPNFNGGGDNLYNNENLLYNGARNHRNYAHQPKRLGHYGNKYYPHYSHKTMRKRKASDRYVGDDESDHSEEYSQQQMAKTELKKENGAVRGQEHERYAKSDSENLQQ